MVTQGILFCVGTALAHNGLTDIVSGDVSALAIGAATTGVANAARTVYSAYNTFNASSSGGSDENQMKTNAIAMGTNVPLVIGGVLDATSGGLLAGASAGMAVVMNGVRYKNYAEIVKNSKDKSAEIEGNNAGFHGRNVTNTSIETMGVIPKSWSRLRDGFSLISGNISQKLDTVKDSHVYNEIPEVLGARVALNDVSEKAKDIALTSNISTGVRMSFNNASGKIKDSALLSKLSSAPCVRIVVT